MGIHKSTVHRLLATLESRRFVNRNEGTGLYHLGLRFIEMASLVLKDVDLQRWARPYLQRLADECGETVDLAVLDGTHVVYLEVVESPQRVKIAAAVGQRLPAPCTASGKAFMAFLPDDHVAAIIDAGLTRHTEQTLVSPQDLYEDLRRTRERGFAISEQEYEKDINAVAAPILDASGYPVAAIAVVGPSYRLPHERMLANRPTGPRGHRGHRPRGGPDRPIRDCLQDGNSCRRSAEADEKVINEPTAICPSR